MICREKVEGDHKIIPRRLLYRTEGEMNLLIMLSAKKFADWINKARKGDRIIYYRGFLFAPNEQKYSPTQDLRRVNNMRKSIYEAYEHNLVTLVQKKHDNFDYEYIAVRS